MGNEKVRRKLVNHNGKSANKNIFVQNTILLFTHNIIEKYMFHEQRTSSTSVQQLSGPLTRSK